MKAVYLKILFLILMSAQGLFAQKTLTLDECKQLALENNVLTKNSRLEIEAADQVKKGAYTNYFPHISGGITAFATKKHLIEFGSAGLLKTGQFGMLTITQPVFTGGRILFGNQLASLGQEVSKYKYSLSRDEAFLKTEEQYWLIVQLNEKMKTISKYEELLKSLLRQVEDGFNSGVVTKNDVLKVKLKHSEVLLNKSKLENGKKIAQLAFCQFLGIKADSDIVLSSGFESIIPPQGCYVDHQAALEKRNEYALLSKSVEAEKLQTKMKFGEYLPQISVGVTGMYTKIDDVDGKTLGMATGMVQVPISGWWEASHSLAERSVKEEMAQNEFKDKSELLLLQMEKVWQDLNDEYKQVALSRESKSQAEENLKLNEDSYKNGLSNLTDLLEAQAMLQQADDHLVESLANYKSKYSSYLVVTGR